MIKPKINESFFELGILGLAHLRFLKSTVIIITGTDQNDNFKEAGNNVTTSTL